MAGIKIRTSKFEATVLSRERAECPFQVRDGPLPRVEVLLMSEEQEIDRWIGVVSAVNAKLIYIPTLAYGYELWVVTEKR